MQTLSPGTGLTSFVIGVLSNAAFALVIVGLAWLRKRLASQNPRYRRVVPWLTFAAWLVFNFCYVYFIGRYSYFVLATSTFLGGWILFQEINQFWSLGLVGADKEIIQGVDYVKALRLCSNSLEFLGIGASKLTQTNQEFADAVNRCNRPRPIRFLLSSPDNAGLQKIARSAGVNENSYQNTVRNSLRVIATLKRDREKNIEVRFYQEFPAFRLMFIDDEICLASHFVLGKGDGSRLPQLQIIKKNDSQDVNSLYYGFRSYFDNLWEQSEPGTSGSTSMNKFFPAGSVHGRFQPFHNDHLEYTLAAKERCAFLWIGITKYDITPIEASPLARPRERPDHNPLTYFERINMITNALVEAGVQRADFGFIPFPIETPNRLPSFMPRSIPCFTTIREDWNREKIGLLQACGYEVNVLWERPEKSITGGIIRDDIFRGGGTWRSMVPPATARAVEELRLRDRLIALNKTAGLPRVDQV